MRMALACVQPTLDFQICTLSPANGSLPVSSPDFAQAPVVTKMQEGNNYPSYISSFKIFKVASQYLYALGHNLLGSSFGSFSKLDQPCHPIPTLRLKPAGHLPNSPAVLKDSENGN